MMITPAQFLAMVLLITAAAGLTRVIVRRRHVQRLRVLDDEGLTSVEEPTLAHDFAGHALVAREAATPIPCGENWWGSHEMRQAVEARASDYMMLDSDEDWCMV